LQNLKRNGQNTNNKDFLFLKIIFKYLLVVGLLGALMSAIKIKNLTKSYGNFLALKGINLEIEEGEIFALLGPNGAGKTTLIRILAEGLKFDSGDIEVFEEKLSKKTARLIGYVPQESISYDLLTVEENLGFYADLYNAPMEKVKELIKRFDLPSKKKAK